MQTFREFYQSKFYLQNPQTLKAGLPIVTDDFGRMLELLFDPSNRARTILLGLSKKSGKSGLMSAISLYEALTNGESDVWVANNSYEAGKGRVFEIIEYALRKSKLFSSPSNDPLYVIKDDRIAFVNHSRIIVMPSSARSLAGGNQILSVSDELWASVTVPDINRYHELTPPPGGRSYRVLASYAGLPDSVILRSVWDLVLAGERLDDRLPIFYNREADVSGVIDGFNGEYFFRLPWVNQEFLDKERRSSPYNAYFERLYMNHWASTSGLPLISEDDYASMRDSRIELISV